MVDTFEIQHRTLYSLHSNIAMRSPSSSLLSRITSVFVQRSTSEFSHSLHYPYLLLCEKSWVYVVDVSQLKLLHSVDLSQFVDSACSVVRSVLHNHHLFLLVSLPRKRILLHLHEINLKWHLLHYTPLPASTAVTHLSTQLSVRETPHSLEVYCIAPLTRPSILVISLTSQVNLTSVSFPSHHHP